MNCVLVFVFFFSTEASVADVMWSRLCSWVAQCSVVLDLESHPAWPSKCNTGMGYPGAGGAKVVVNFLLEFVLLFWGPHGIIREYATVYQNGLHGILVAWGPFSRANLEECCKSPAPFPCRFAYKAMRRAGAKQPVSFLIILLFSYLVDHSNHFYLILLSSWGLMFYSEYFG